MSCPARSGCGQSKHRSQLSSASTSAASPPFSSPPASKIQTHCCDNDKDQASPIQFAAYLASNKKCALLSIEALYIQPVLLARLFFVAQKQIVEMTSQNFQKMSQTGSSRPSRSGSFSSDFAPPSRVNLEKICSKAPQVLI